MTALLIVFVLNGLFLKDGMESALQDAMWYFTYAGWRSAHIWYIV